jgi:hypothetical protein
MSQLVKTKCQANFKDFKRFGAFKGLVKQKNDIFNSSVRKLTMPKKPNLHTNSLNKLLFLHDFWYSRWTSKTGTKMTIT